MFESQQSVQLLDLGYLTLGSVIFTTGLVALLINLLRYKYRDWTLAFFGCLSIMVGLHFLANTDTIRLLMGGGPYAWSTGRTALNYLLAVTAFAFICSYLGSGWRFSLHWASWGYVIFACAALVSLIIPSIREFFIAANYMVIILVLVTCFANCVRPVYRKDHGAQFIAIFCMGGIIYFLLKSLGSLNILSVNFHNEWARLTIFHSSVVVLVLVVRFFFIREERLAAVRLEMSTARRIQSSILPKAIPTVTGLNIASRYEPMTEVAGDFYDFIVTDEGCLGVLVADVSGHGVPAALIASMVKVVFLAQSDQAGEPARILTGMNRVFGDLLESQFVTAGYAFIDMNTRQLHYSGAGHPPLLIRPAVSGDIVLLEKNGLMLGPFPEAIYESVSFDLTPGDRVVMYTDGFIEAINGEGEQFGGARLQRFLAGSSPAGAENFADDLLAEVTAWEGRRQSDDLTLIVIDILPNAFESDVRNT